VDIHRVSEQYEAGLKIVFSVGIDGLVVSKMALAMYVAREHGDVPVESSKAVTAVLCDEGEALNPLFWSHCFVLATTAK
jgi:hypothetical protein